jgi:hypothetical protein
MNMPKEHSPEVAGPRSDEPDASTPGRPRDSSRQQKHEDQNLDSGSETLDKRSSGDRTHRTPTPPNAK